jgi:GMP synthase-like glutamine amidotransferase
MTALLNIHCLQHVPFEGPAGIGDWISGHGHRLTTTHLYRGEVLPSLESVDWIVVMGGPMNVYEYRLHPWLREEKNFLAAALEANKTILGVCLGAQLLADVLGAKVYQNPEKEIGWLPISLRSGTDTDLFFPGAPRELTVFHWHGDTFDLPAEANWLASSVGCAHQAFAFGERVVGLQFHIETTPMSVAALIENCGNELTEGRFIQTATRITEDRAHFRMNQQVLKTLLEQLEGRAFQVQQCLSESTKQSNSNS